ncbi:MAG: hypothetical protein IH985_09240 [Planctomycetes bacterium]|nr:hypothetical protein [Planctomycetota bacterium]
MIGIWLGLVVALLVGCALGTPPDAPPEPHSRSWVRGDFDDATAAVFAAATWTEMALGRNGPSHIETLPDGSTRAVYTLLTIRDERVYFEVRQSPDAQPGRYEVICRVGRFSNPALERDFVRAFETRLEQLRGIGATPIRK